MQLWRDGQTWVRGESQVGTTGIGGRGPVRKRRAIAVCLAALVLVLGLLFTPALVAELRLRSLQQPATLGPLVVEPTEVHGVPFLQVAGSRPPIYSGEGVPLEKVEWAREGVRIGWQEAPRITGLRQPGDESPLFLFADRDQYLAHGRKLWGQRFGQLGWETCAFIGGRATACDVSRVASRAVFISALAHELTHQLIYAEFMRGAVVPLWLNEGLAQYVDGQVYAAHIPAVPVRGLGAANHVAQALRFGRYQRLEQLKWNTPDEQYVAYAYAHSALAVRSLVERFGMNAVADLVRRSGPRSFTDTFAGVFGRTLPDFETELEESLRTALLGPGRVLYQDDFTEPSSRWRRSWNDHATDLLAYKSGEYSLLVAAESGPTQGVWHRLPFGDFQAGIDVRLTQPVEHASVFLDFRIQANDNRYRFSVDPSSGQFALHHVIATEARPVIGNTPAPPISGGTAANRLGVRVEGADVALLVNGEEVGRAHDPRFREGRIGFGVASPHGEPAEARFSNLVITSVN